MRVFLAMCLLMTCGSAVLGSGWRQKEFLITFWCPPPATDEALARVAAENFTMTWTDEAGLDTAARHGLKSMLTSGLLAPETLDEFDRDTCKWVRYPGSGDGCTARLAAGDGRLFRIGHR